MYIDPASLIGTMLRAAGIASMLLLVVGGAVLLLVLLVALRRRWTALAHRAATGLAIVVGVWGAALLASIALLRGHTVAPGDELAFCGGLDCHLHVGVRAVERRGRLAVRLAFRSDARREPEYPSLLDIAVVSTDGRRFPPVAGDVGGALAAASSREATLEFDVPEDARALRLVPGWRGAPGWLLPGPDNVLVQRRTGIALDIAVAP
jgi:hypothetical protein